MDAIASFSVVTWIQLLFERVFHADVAYCLASISMNGNLTSVFVGLSVTTYSI